MLKEWVTLPHDKVRLFSIGRHIPSMIMKLNMDMLRCSSSIGLGETRKDPQCEN